MSSNKPKNNPSSLPETGPHVWVKMREYFRGRRSALRDVRDKDGLEAAQFDHSCEMADLGNSEDWELMFDQALLREPHSTRAIKDARLAYLMFHNRIQDQMNELEMMHAELIDVLERFREYIEDCQKHMVQPQMILELEIDDEELEQYEELAIRSGEARTIIEEIRMMIDDLNQLGSKYSK